MYPVAACLERAPVSWVLFYLQLSFQCHLMTLAVIFRSAIFIPKVWVSQET